jgi:hypothetical protein
VLQKGTKRRGEGRRKREKEEREEEVHRIDRLLVYLTLANLCVLLTTLLSRTSTFPLNLPNFLFCPSTSCPIVVLNIFNLPANPPNSSKLLSNSSSSSSSLAVASNWYLPRSVPRALARARAPAAFSASRSILWYVWSIR